MTRILIIEDEAPAQALLKKSLEALSGELELQVIATIPSIKGAVEWFRDGGQPDLVLCDIQLEDGHSFHIFQQVSVKAPVVFITGFDNYVLQALECNGIDYLLKPVHEEELRKALRKYTTLRQHFTGGMQGRLEQLLEGAGRRRRNRIIVQKGLEQVALPLSDIVLFYTEQKVVFVLDRHGNKYIYDKPLQLLEEELDPLQFFRANRQYLIHIDYIHSFRPFDKSKLRVEMDLAGKGHEIVISQETAPKFRRWIQA